MPNYCMNKLDLEGDVALIKELLAFVKSEESDFDLNKVIPMPESIKSTERGSLSFASEAVCIYQNDGEISNHLKWMMEKSKIKEDKLDETIKKWIKQEKVDLCLGQRIIANRKKYNGCGDWYEWCIDNWGTKWEACEVEIGDGVITFETAWSPCSPIIEKLAGKFPQLSFIYKYFEPGVSLAGKQEYSDGVCNSSLTYDGDEQEYQLIGEEFGYEFIEEDEE